MPEPVATPPAAAPETESSVAAGPSLLDVLGVTGGDEAPEPVAAEPQKGRVKASRQTTPAQAAPAADEAAGDPAAVDGEPAEAEPTPEQAKAARAEERREKISKVHAEAQARRERARRQEERANALVAQAEQRRAELEQRAADIARREKLLTDDPEAWAAEVAKASGKRGDDIFESWAKRRVNGGARDPGEVAAELEARVREQAERYDAEIKKIRDEREEEKRQGEVHAVKAQIETNIGLIVNARDIAEDREKWPNLAAEPKQRVRDLAVHFYRRAAAQGADPTDVQTAVAVADAIERLIAEENSERFSALGVQRGSGSPSDGLSAANPAGTGTPAPANPVAGTPRTITNARAASAGSVRRDLTPREKQELAGQYLIDAFPSLRPHS